MASCNKRTGKGGINLKSSKVTSDYLYVYRNERVNLTREISFLQKYNLRFLMIPLIFDLLILIKSDLTGKRVLSLIIIAVFIIAAIFIDELSNRLKIKILKKKIKNLNILESYLEGIND